MDVVHHLSNTTIIVSVLVPAAIFIWINFIKTGPVYRGKESLEGKTVLITGANVGIGKETVICLARRKARVIIACRNEKKAVEALEEIKEKSGSELVHFMKLDLSDMESIRIFAEDFVSTEQKLDILINNAGIISSGFNKDGFDITIATNQLGPFLLTILLMPVMKKTSETRPVRIVNVSAELYKLGKIDFETLQPTPNKALSMVQNLAQYPNSKLMNVYFTSELNKRLRSDDPDCRITTYSLHPGVVHTQLGADFIKGEGMLVSMYNFFRNMMMSLIAQSAFYGCQTTLYCCLMEGLESKTGKYFMNMKMKKLTSIATDSVLSEKLWKRCEEITGCSFP